VHLVIDRLESGHDPSLHAGLSPAGQAPSNTRSNCFSRPAQASGVGTGYSSPDLEAQAFRQLAPIPEPACLETRWSGADEDLLEPAADDPHEPHEYFGPLEPDDKPEPSQEPPPM